MDWRWFTVTSLNIESEKEYSARESTLNAFVKKQYVIMRKKSFKP